MVSIPNFSQELEFETNFRSQIFLCKDDLDYLYLVKKMRQIGDGYQWLALPVSRERLEDLTDRKITLKDAVLSSETGTLFGFWTSITSKEQFSYIEFDCNKVPPDFLPLNNEYLL